MKTLNEIGGKMRYLIFSIMFLLVMGCSKEKTEQNLGQDSTKTKLETVNDLDDLSARKTANKWFEDTTSIKEWHGLYRKSEYEVRASVEIESFFYDFLSGTKKPSTGYGEFVYCKDMNDNWVLVRCEFNPRIKGLAPINYYLYFVVENAKK